MYNYSYPVYIVSLFLYIYKKINITNHIVCLIVCIIFRINFDCSLYNMKAILQLLESENVLLNVKQYLIYVTYIQILKL